MVNCDSPHRTQEEKLGKAGRRRRNTQQDVRALESEKKKKKGTHDSGCSRPRNSPITTAHRGFISKGKQGQGAVNKHETRTSRRVGPLNDINSEFRNSTYVAKKKKKINT